MDLKNFFNPKSVAIVGVSHDERKVGFLTAKNMLEQKFSGELYFINNKFSGEILGKRVYQDIKSIGKLVDLAILAVPANISVGYLDALHEAGVKNAVVYAAGFREIGSEGEILANELIDKSAKYQINVLGPNCIGFVNTAIGLNATFLKNACPAGNIGFVSQSGALGSFLNDYFLAHRNLGFSLFASLGNKAVIDESDVLEYLANDGNTRVIGMYLEDIKNGDKFRKAALSASEKKPIIVIKSGSTKEGSQAAVSHTAGMVGDDQVYDTVFKQCGIIRVTEMQEFTTMLKVFSYGRAPQGKSVLILSNAGGAGVLLTDSLIEKRVPLVTVSEEIKSNLAKAAGGKKITVHNPIDLLGDASAFDYEQAIDRAIEEKGIGSVVVLLTPQANTQIEDTAQIIVDIQKKYDHPLYPIFMGKHSMAGVGRLFEDNKIAGFANFDFLPEVIAKILVYQDWLESSQMGSLLYRLTEDKTGASPVNKENIAEIEEILAGTNSRNFLSFDLSLRILELAGIPVVVPQTLNTLEQLEKADFIFPVVAKTANKDITHKTEGGGVVVDIKSQDELRSVFAKMGAMYVQKMAKGAEILIGAKRDPVFGPVVVTGLGGVYTELLKEISYRVFPFGRKDFELMVGETKLDKLTKGFRGQPPIDMEGLFRIASRVGWLMENFPKIKEIDINPLMASGEEILAVDGRIIL